MVLGVLERIRAGAQGLVQDLGKSLGLGDSGRARARFIEIQGSVHADPRLAPGDSMLLQALPYSSRHSAVRQTLNILS